MLLGYSVICAWTLAGTVTFIRSGEVPAAHTLFHELRPLYLPAVVVAHVSASALVDGPAPAISTAFSLNTWFFLKDRGGDDDRWKRRRRKAAEKISRVGGRLAVQPVHGGA